MEERRVVEELGSEGAQKTVTSYRQKAEGEMMRGMIVPMSSGEVLPLASMGLKGKAIVRLKFRRKRRGEGYCIK